MTKLNNVKKLFAFLIIIFIFIFISFNNDKFIDLCSYYNNASLSVFCENYIEPNDDLFVAIKNGDSYIIQTKANKASEVLKFLTNCSGFMLTFNGTKENIKNLLSEIKIIKTEKSADIEIFYAYTCGLLYSTVIDGKKVNFQVAINKNVITIGSPLILGSY